MLDVEPIGQCDRKASGSGRNGNEASEAFARWLHRRQGLVYMQHLHGMPRQTAFGGVTSSCRRPVTACFIRDGTRMKATL